MPMLNGYSIYVAAPSALAATWLVRVYRDADDQHIHSSEGCDTLAIGMREAERAITKDVNAQLGDSITRAATLTRSRRRARGI